MKRFARLGFFWLTTWSLLVPNSVWAWGDEGHEIVASIAYARLTPQVRTRFDAILATDPDTLTASDFVSRATWADRYRDSDRNSTQFHYKATRAWHFVDIEIDGGSLGAACPDHAPDPKTPASRGPADDCVVRKVDQFSAELADSATPAAERLLALKFLLHFVGDMHQPLHAADHQDAGGNAVNILYPGITMASNLHSYWDNRLVKLLGTDPKAVAQTIGKSITAADAAQWQQGTPALWAQDSFEQAKEVAYNLADQPSSADSKGVACVELTSTYDARALPVVRLQLAKAGVRLAAVLNQAIAEQ